jgi:purine-cytosine permease-like protein
MVAVLAVVPSFIVFWGRSGRRWGFVAYFVGAAVGLAFAVTLAFADNRNPIARAGDIGGAIPASLLMPFAGIWASKRSYQRANAAASLPSHINVPVDFQVTAIASIAISAAIIIGGFLVGGIYTTVAGKTGELQGGTTYVVNRFTGSVRVCNQVSCRRPLDELPPDFFNDLIPKH